MPRYRYTIDVSLPAKGLWFVIEAVEHKLKWYDKKMKIAEEAEDYDSLSEMANDSALLKIMLNELKDALEKASREWQSKQS
jgi:hypothetical protein